MSKYVKAEWENVGKLAEVMTGEHGEVIYKFAEDCVKSGWKKGYFAGAGVAFSSLIIAESIDKAKQRRKLRKLERENRY